MILIIGGDLDQSTTTVLNFVPTVQLLKTCIPAILLKIGNKAVFFMSDLRRIREFVLFWVIHHNRELKWRRHQYR